MASSWFTPWLYPASSEPPPQRPDFDWFDSPRQMPVFPEWRPPHYEQTIFPPIPDTDVPFVESTWSMVCTTWSVATLTSKFKFVIEEPVVRDHWLDDRKQMPAFPPWIPPEHPSFYLDELEAIHSEVFEYRTLPIWPDWRPVAHPESFVGSDEEAAEEIFIDKYENLPRLPVWTPPSLHYIWYPGEQDEPPIPEGWDFIPSMGPLPPPRPYFMPEAWTPHYIDEGHPGLCPPPCLRRPPPTCPSPPPRDRPLAEPTPP